MRSVMGDDVERAPALAAGPLKGQMWQEGEGPACWVRVWFRQANGLVRVWPSFPTGPRSCQVLTARSPSPGRT